MNFVSQLERCVQEMAQKGLTSECISPESTEAEPGGGNCRNEGDQYEAASGSGDLSTCRI
eukprot:1156498-Pelagomonas_calceolata.AAC.1